MGNVKYLMTCEELTEFSDRYQKFCNEEIELTSVADFLAEHAQKTCFIEEDCDQSKYLSCGHLTLRVKFEDPQFCSKCGAKIIYKKGDN